MTALRPPALETILATGRTVGGAPVHSGINRAFAAALQRHVATARPARALETGCAFGVSALAILGGSDDVHLTSVDPDQTAEWGGQALAAIAASGLADRHRLVEAPSHVALPQLLGEGARFQLAYIDGWHTFDGALLDFLYVHRMLDVGGTVVFNDCGLPAVHKAVRFVQTHRDYEELDAGLPRDVRGTSRLDTLRRRLVGHRQEDRYFRKRSDAEPAWDFFARF